VVASERHVAPRLVVGDVRAGQGGDPPGMTAHSGTPNRQGTPPDRAKAPAGVSLRPGYARPPADPGAAHPD
jgi:hypothetical protein